MQEREGNHGYPRAVSGSQCASVLGRGQQRVSLFAGDSWIGCRRAQENCYRDPVTPHWFSDITLHNLCVGASTVTLRFWIENAETRYEVLAAKGKLHVEQRRGVEAGT
jgi:hypothetical protein